MRRGILVESLARHSLFVQSHGVGVLSLTHRFLLLASQSHTLRFLLLRVPLDHRMKGRTRILRGKLQRQRPQLYAFLERISSLFPTRSRILNLLPLQVVPNLEYKAL